MLIGIFCLLLCVTTLVGQVFRSDYNFFDQAGGWLKLHTVPASWSDARLRCHLEGAVLASPLNDNLASAMASMMTRDKTRTVFTGISAAFSRGDFSAIEGVSLSMIPNLRGPPDMDNRDDLESCIAMHNFGALTDVRCQQVLRYICYKQYDPKDPSMEKQNECGSIDPEYIQDETGSCYKFHREPRHWSRAFMTCNAEGGHLAVINSQNEARILARMFSSIPISTIKLLNNQLALAYIGFHDWGEHGTWSTIHGQTLQEAGYSNWAADSNQPNNASSAETKWEGEYCGGISLKAELHDVWCDHALSFICEKDPKALAVES